MCVTLPAVLCATPLTLLTMPWCLAPSLGKLMAPVFDALAAQHDDVRFIKVDIDTEALADTVAAARVSAVVRQACLLPVAQLR